MNTSRLNMVSVSGIQTKWPFSSATSIVMRSHSLGTLIEWKLVVEINLNRTDNAFPLAGDINWMETVRDCQQFWGNFSSHLLGTLIASKSLIKVFKNLEILRMINMRSHMVSASQTHMVSTSQKHWGNCDRNRCSKTTSKKLTFVLEVLSKYPPKKV